jgi:PKD repeat protein
VRFASDGDVLVAEMHGRVKRFDGLGDPTPETVLDLTRNVHGFWDRGLLGIALDPNYASNQRIYVLYTHDAAIGGTAPRWGNPDSPVFDGCPNPPGATSDGCVVSGRLSQITLNGTPNPPEQVLIEDWCQQYPSHSIGNLEFDSQGNLYASAGDGASFTFTDWGQDGNPVNPCQDPGGTAPTPPTAQGGALRSQDLRTAGDPVGLDGTVIKVNPATGAGLPSNPNGGSADANTRRIIAHGLRNPFRFAISPDNELWIGDVGWSSWEELNRMTTSPSTVVNFGWPCYEGAGRQPGYDSANLSICEGLYSAGNPVASPAFTYPHSAPVVPGETCPTGSSSVTGVDFYEGGPFPAAYDDALFFADYSRDCIWVIRNGASGTPDPATVTTFATGDINPTFLQTGPGGALYYTDFENGAIRRIAYTATNQAPTADATANPTSGSAPLAVSFNGSGSSDPDPGDTLDYAWDLDGDGQYDDSTAVSPNRTYTTPGTVFVRLRVTDDAGATATDTVRIDVGNDPPVPAISQPTASRTWEVGEVIGFSGGATDPQQGNLPASALDWSLIIDHCPSNCHQHPVQTFPDVASGSFSAPDHEYPSDLLLRLTATDAQGASATKEVTIDPRTVNVTVQTSPSGLNVALNSAAGASPLSRTVIEGSTNSISAPSPQTFGGRIWNFASWSDGGAASHSIVADTNRTLTATYSRQNAGPTAAASANPTTGSAPLAVSLSGSGSSDPDPGDTLDYAWDLDGDGQYDDSTAVSPNRTYGVGTHVVRLRVTDDDGATDTDSVTVTATNDPPTAVASADPQGGPVPLTVDFDGSGSSDPDPGDTLDYAWDLDGDGQYDDSTAVSPTRTYSAVATVVAGLEVTDDDGAGDTDTVVIQAGNHPPVPAITAPAANSRWTAGEAIPFSGGATDPEDGTLGPAALDWELSAAGAPLASFPGTASGTLTAPDRRAPTPLTLALTATDSDGLAATAELSLDPRTVELTIASDPAGLELGLNDERAATPFTRTVVEGSSNDLSAGSPQQLGADQFEWRSWSDGGAAEHSIRADASQTFSALFSPFDIREAPPRLELERIKVKVPATVQRLLERGAWAKLRCNLSCRVVMKLVTRGRVAKEIGLKGTIGRARAELDAETKTKLVVELRGRAVRKLERAKPALRPRVKARFEASPAG